MITAENINKIIAAELEALKARIIANMGSNNRNASGATAQSLRVETGENEGVLTARPFFAALETGSKPWRNQYSRPPKFFIQIIQEWINAKGLSLEAGAVASNLMRHGSKIYRNGGVDNIYSKELQPTIDKINEKVGVLYQAEIEQIIKQNLKK